MYNWEASRILLQRHPITGVIYSVAGAKMHLYCTGSGAPTVIMEAGLGRDWLDAQPVQQKLSRFTRVCSYDRSGLGWSPQRAGVRDATTIAHELNALLKTAGVPPPFVLMGHSGGGVFALEFAHRFPEEVAAVVLAEAASPRQFDDLPGYRESVSAYLTSEPAKIRWRRLREWTGLQRLTGRCNGDRSLPSPDLRWLSKAESCRLDYEGADLLEYVDFEQSAQEAAQLTSLGDKPLLILSRDPSQISRNARKQDAMAWERMQESLAALSKRSLRVTVPGAGHELYRDRPDFVTDQVVNLLAELRTSKP